MEIRIHVRQSFVALLLLLVGGCEKKEMEVAPLDETGGVPLMKLPCGSYRTFTQAGWGKAPADFASPGAYRDRFFRPVFFNNAVDGLVIGIVNDSRYHYLRFSSVTALQNFFPQTPPPAPLSSSAEEPSAGAQFSALAGEVAAFKLNLYYDDFEHRHSTLRTGIELRYLTIKSGIFQGMDVWGLRAVAERVLGGDPARTVTYQSASGTNRTYTFTVEQLQEVLVKINQNFEGGTVDKGYLSCQ